MPSTTSKNLGQVSAFIKGAIAPTNTSVIWFDISGPTSIKKIYDPISSSWIPLTQTSGESSDGWGTQVVVTDETLEGEGIEGNELKIAQQLATTGQVLKWDGSSWKPGDDETGDGIDEVTHSTEFIGLGTITSPLKLATPPNPSTSENWYMKWSIDSQSYVPSKPENNTGLIKGMILMWHVNNNIPAGWLPCDGNNGNQVNGVSIPDFRGRTPFGFDTTNTKFNAINKKGGVESVQLTIAQMPKHSHGVIDPGHAHSYKAPLTNGRHPGGGDGFDRPNGSENGTTATAKTNITIESSGNGDSHENLPPYNTILFIIKVTD